MLWIKYTIALKTYSIEVIVNDIFRTYVLTLEYSRL